MKRILITGANSYIGTSFENYIKQFEGYQIDTVDMIDGTWREYDFSKYEVVFHVAGIAHIKETKDNRHLYYDVNRDLAIDTAKFAKNNGVKQFVLLSTMSVYGQVTGSINKETIPVPKTSYGKSKLEAEREISKLEDETFRVAILRPPMVYGRGCKGNFQTILKLVMKLPVFPRINNSRSVIYIGNLCSFVKNCIDRDLSGIFFPQNRHYVRTDELAMLISKEKNKKLHLSFICGFGVWFLKPFSNTVKKAFGTLVYKDTEDFDFEYCVTDFEKSIKESV